MVFSVVYYIIWFGFTMKNIYKDDLSLLHNGQYRIHPKKIDFEKNSIAWIGYDFYHQHFLVKKYQMMHKQVLFTSAGSFLTLANVFTLTIKLIVKYLKVSLKELFYLNNKV